MRDGNAVRREAGFFGSTRAGIVFDKVGLPVSVSGFTLSNTGDSAFCKACNIRPLCQTYHELIKPYRRLNDGIQRAPPMAFDGFAV
ncbi:hypothetical protein [Hyphococcus luteus]|uniref:Uncharacterized protein n=1 Tax=Hyphococcus luteus TaxID=2058213 RepID=A0A2S7KAN8_9PROT|nr:hypothetical protein [Marinicaulis flavus]PQA89543.1 hypothetical protein CW354_01335 [Marinicaulis flavus]